MPEEYVYKIVVDDAEIQRTLDRVDQRIKTMAVAADKSFAGIGTQMSAGLRQVSQQSQRTSQQMVQGQLKVEAARRLALQGIDDEIAAMRKKRVAAERTAEGERRALEQGRKALQEIRRERAQAQAEIEGFRRAGARPVDAAASEQVERAAARRETTFEAGIAEVEPSVAAAEAEVASTTQAYDQLVERRAAMADEIAQSAQTQQAAETAAAQQTAQSVMSGLNERQQASISAAQAELQSAQTVVAEKQRVVQAAREEVVAAKAATDAARVSAAQKGANAKTAAAQIEAVSKQEIRAQKEVTEARKTGTKDEIASAEEKKKALTERLQSLEQEKEAAKTAQAAQQAGIAKLVQAENQKKQAVAEASEAVKEASNKEKAARQALTAETKRASQEQTKSARKQRQGEAAFKRTTKTYNQQRNELNELAKKYGSFNVVLGRTSGELNKQEKEVMDIIQSDKQLEAEIEKLISKYGQLNVAMDRSTFRGGQQGRGLFGTGVQGQQARQAGFAAQRFGIPGAAVLGEAAMVGGGTGVAVAGVLLSVQALTKAFIGMGKAAASAFGSVVKSGMDAAKEIEIAAAQFDAFFQGDTQASEAAMNRLLNLSKELGENVVGIGRAFLPEVESLDQLEEVVKAATALARFQPEQGIMGARIALQEALGGEFRSLQRRFEISPVAIDKIREAYEASGVTGFLEELQGELSRTGRSVEDLSDTWGVAMGRVKEQLRQVTAELGKPILDEYKDQLKGIDEELDRLEPDLKLIANAFGEVLSRIVDIIGTQIQAFLKDFDPEPLLNLAESAFRVVSAIETIIQVAEPGKVAAGGLGIAADGLAGLLLRLEGWLLSVAYRMNEFRADFKETVIGIVNAIRVMSRAFEIGGRITSLNMAWWLDSADAFNDMLDDIVWSMEKMEDLEPFSWAELMDDYNQRVEDFTDGLDDLRDSLAGTGDAGEQAANDFALYQQATDDARIAAEEFAAAQEKVNEVLGEFEIKADIKFEKLLTNVARQALDDEIDAQRKLVDIEIKNKEKIASIRDKFDQSIIDAGQELGDREADIARKNGDALLDLEEDLADKRIELEEDYQDDLERLRDKFNFDAFEAILANDAKRLRQIRRRQAFEESQAKKDRDKNRENIEDEGKDKRADLEKQRQRELRDAQIVNARKIRDIQQGLQQQLDAQEKAREQDLINAQRAEDRKGNDLQMSLDRQLDDYRAWWIERNRVTQEKVAEDKALAEEMAQNWQDAQDKIAGIGLPGLGAQQQQPGPYASGYVFPQQAASQAGAGSINQLLLADVMKQIVDIQSAFAQQAGQPVDTAALEDAVARMSVPALVQELTNLQSKLDVFTALEFDISTVSLDDLAERLTTPQPLEELVETPEIAALRDQTFELARMLIERDSHPRFAETEVETRERLSELDLKSLIEELDKIQENLRFAMPGATGVMGAPTEFDAIETQGLFEKLLTQQAQIIAEAAGLDPAEILRAITEPGRAGEPMTGEQIETYLSRLVVKAEEAAAAAEKEEAAPPATTTTPTAAGGLGLVGVAAQDEPTPVTIVTPSGQPALSGLGVIPPTPPEPEEDEMALVPANLMPPRPGLAGVGGVGAGEDEPVPVTVTDGGFPILPGINVPFGDDNITIDTDATGPIPVMVVTPAGQAIADARQQQGVPTPDMPGAFIQPTDPSAGFTSAGIMDAIEAEVEALATAELEKVGEIENTAEHAALMAEAKLLATTAALTDEVGAYKAASDEEIAILESTLASHQSALAAIGDDPLLAADAAVLETSIGILNETLERLRAEQLAATEAALSDEVAAIEDAEKEKVDMVDETSALIGLAYLDRETAIAAGLMQEVADTEKATDAETALVQAALASQGEASTEHRAAELEATEIQEEEKTDIFTGAQQEHLSDLHSFWLRWLSENNRAMRADLTQMYQWLQERQKMFELAIHTIPGSVPPGGGPLPEDEEEEPPPEPITSISQLRSLATDLATTLGILDQYVSLISSLPYDDLAALVLNWQGQVKAGDYALGGGVTPGYAWVGEDGPELVRFNQAARIDPAALFRNQPPAGVGGGVTTIDQSTSTQFSFPDPRGIPPTYIATMENIAAKVVKKSLRGR